MTKVCSKCGVEKDIEEFVPRAKNLDGREGRCKDCIKECARVNAEKRRRARGCKIYKSYPETTDTHKFCSKCGRILPLNQFYKASSAKDGLFHKCKDCTNEAGKLYYQENKDTVDQRHRAYSEKTKHTRASKQKAYSDSHKEATAKRSKEWYAKNKEKIKEREKQRIKDNPDVQIRRALRARIIHALNGDNKSANTMALIGCDIEFLKSHLEAQFLEGMTWGNYGVRNRTWKDNWWTVDHIRPCALFDLSNPEEQRICFHWTNLQPMWWRDNISKSDKWTEQDQIKWEARIAHFNKEQSTPVSA